MKKFITYKQWLKLFEGGNVFEGTGPIQKKNIEPTLEQFQKRISTIFPKVNFEFQLLGSAGKKEVSGDIDVALSEETIFDKNGNIKYDDWDISSEEFEKLYLQIRKRARTASEKQSKFRTLIKLVASKLVYDKEIAADTKNSGAGTLFCSYPQYTPEGEQLNKRVQIDINIGNLNWLKFSYHSEAYKGNVKGLHRTQLLVSLFKNKNKTFRHGTGVFNLETKEYEASSPEEAIDLLNEIYDFKTNKLNRDIIKNYFKLQDFLNKNLNEEELHKIYDIYLKILDSTRTDVPEDLQNYWIEHQDRLNLTGRFLPENSNLYKYKK